MKSSLEDVGTIEWVVKCDSQFATAHLLLHCIIILSLTHHSDGITLMRNGQRCTAAMRLKLGFSGPTQLNN
jgi:hypothetical protein